jgi:hypothetical protein
MKDDDSDWSEWNKHFKTLKDIRKQRSKPSHTLIEDEFDQKYYKSQREIMINAYCALRFIRRVFALHPEVNMQGSQFPKVWTQIRYGRCSCWLKVKMSAFLSKKLHPVKCDRQAQ